LSTTTNRLAVCCTDGVGLRLLMRKAKEISIYEIFTDFLAQFYEH
jgi:hypothetical protein